MISMDINIVLPEITLAVFAMAALMVAVYGGKDRLAGLMFWSTWNYGFTRFMVSIF